MLSYNWDYQGVVKRINSSLQGRGYNVWIDIEKMQGSTVEAMADAVEGATVMCYAVSRGYKESANCRLEAQYAYQRQKEMVPLMVEEGYSADGWLGMLLGTRVWYLFYGPVLSEEDSFEAKVSELCRELGTPPKLNPKPKPKPDRAAVLPPQPKRGIKGGGAAVAEGVPPPTAAAHPHAGTGGKLASALSTPASTPTQQQQRQQERSYTPSIHEDGQQSRGESSMLASPSLAGTPAAAAAAEESQVASLSQGGGGGLASEIAQCLARQQHVRMPRSASAKASKHQQSSC